MQIRAPAYVTASALAKEPSATECMAHGHLARQSDARLLECADPLARYDSVSPGCSHWPVIRRKTVMTDASSTGWGAICDGRPAFGDMIRNGEVVAHKLSGAPCCTPSAQVLSPGHSPPSRSHQEGQHDSGSVYKSLRRCELAATAAASERPAFVGRSTPPFHPSSTCPRTPELRHRFTVEGRGNPRGVEITLSDSQNDLECIRQGGGGSLRISGEHSLPAVRCI